MDGAGIDAQDSGDLIHRQVVVVTQDDGQPMLLAQPLHRLPDRVVGLALHHGALRRGRAGACQPVAAQKLVQVLPALALAQPAAADIQADGVQPGAQRALAAVTGQAAQRGQKNLLGGLIGVRGIVQNGQRQAIDGRLVYLHQSRHGFLVAGPAPFH